MAILKPITTVTEEKEIKDLVCFSHLRWDFVYQRPQHLLSRFAKVFRVFYIEEAQFHDKEDNCFVRQTSENVWVVTPQLHEEEATELELIVRQKALLNRWFLKMEINNYMFWYYTPMALKISDQFSPIRVIYDCMDELSAFKFAPTGLKELEERLFEKSDLVFTGGHCLFEAKKNCHHNIHPFPSSIDKEHFEQAKLEIPDPADQAGIPHPRIGFYGVIDERFNIKLMEQVAKKRPDWHFVLIGPVVKIDPETLPRLENIHYLGGKSYHELPTYLSGWDVTMIPFAKNESTKYISPTKTPEYLAAGKPVISTSIRDVVIPYGEERLVHIADTPSSFINAMERELSTKDKSDWEARVEKFLENISWDKTWNKMMSLVEEILPASRTQKATIRSMEPLAKASV